MLLLAIIISTAFAQLPTVSPSAAPSTAPSLSPSTAPSLSPSTAPSTTPTSAPSYASAEPTSAPVTSVAPTKNPSVTEQDDAVYTVTTTLTMSGVSASNFDDLKDDLVPIIATRLGVSESAVELAWSTTARRMLQTGGILVTITSNDASTAYTVRNTISGNTFAADLSSDIATAAASNPALASVSVTGASTPSVSSATTTTTTTITTTTTATGSTSAFMSLVALIATVLVL